MSNFKHTQIPSFTRRDGNAILFNGEGQLEYYIPENYFGGKNAIVEGSFVRLFGSFNYRIISKTGSIGNLHEFNWPTVFLCRPSVIEKRKSIILDPNNKSFAPGDYRVLIFNDGDQLVTNVFTPEDIDNTKELLALHITTGKIPPNISYTDLYMYPYRSMELNGSKFDIHTQLMGLIYSKICRDPDNPANLFRLSKAIDKDMTSYSPMSIKDVPKYISPYAAISSENMDEGIIASVLLTDKMEEGEVKYQYSPLEQVLMM